MSRIEENKNEINKDNCILSYYQQIKEGTIVVGEYIHQVYEYIIKGLEEKKFFYDGEKANRVIEFMETRCHHSEGVFAPNELKLELWQKAFLSCVYGIVDKNGNRQFREIFLVVARKNGKSLLASGTGYYTICGTDEYGARVYCLAPKLDQAEIIYNDIWQMRELDKKMKSLKDDDPNKLKHRMTDFYLPATNSSVKKLAFSSKKSDGFNPSETINDEIASWQGDKGLKQYEVMASAMGSRPDSFILSITTSGYENDSIYDELMMRSTRFLKGESQETKLLPFLYIIDDVKKWDDINELRKSNPNLNVSVSVDFLLEEIAKAKGSLSKKAEFLTKYCNIKQSSSMAWLPAVAVNNSRTSQLNLEDFANCYCIGGIDLSRTTDLTACTCVIERDGMLNVFAKFFLPAEKIQEASARDNLPYQTYIERGLLMPSGDNFVDYKDCLNWFKDLVEKYKIFPLQIGYDRYSAQYLVQDLKEYGFHLDDVFQGYNLSPVIREFEGLIKDGRVNIGDNDLLKVHLLNTALKTETDSERSKIVKLSQTAHIDGTASLLDAFCVRQKWWSEIGSQLVNGR